MKNIFLWLVLGMLAALYLVSCRKEISSSNKAPVANAGEDQLLVLPKDSVLLNGINSTDQDGVIATWQWTKINGPDQFIIVNAHSSSTMLRSLVVGEYQFELLVRDELGAEGRDTVRILVQPYIGSNVAPVARGGNDQQLVLPTNSCTLSGEASYDPDGTITGYSWSKIEGPSCVIVSPLSQETQVNALIVGTYVFELEVRDNNNALARDTVKVQVSGGTTCDLSSRRSVIARLSEVHSLGLAQAPVAAAAGNKIVIAGGGYYVENGRWISLSDGVDIYDVADHSWTSSMLSQARYEMAAVSVGSKVLFAGGTIIYDDFDNVDVYDVNRNQMSTYHLTRPGTGIPAAVVGTKAYFVLENVMDVYDASNESWSHHYVPSPRYYTSAVALGENIYIAGTNSYNPTGAVGVVVDIYNTRTGQWSSMNLTTARGPVKGAVLGNKIFWIGRDQNRSGSVVETWDMNTGEIASTCLSYMRDNPVTLVNGNQLIILTSADWNYDAVPVDNRFDVYDAEKDEWLTGTLPFNLNAPAVASVNNIIYLAGGKTSSNTVTDKVYTLSW